MTENEINTLFLFRPPPTLSENRFPETNRLNNHPQRNEFNVPENDFIVPKRAFLVQRKRVFCTRNVSIRYIAQSPEKLEGLKQIGNL
jgi:hypothetical protein